MNRFSPLYRGVVAAVCIAAPLPAFAILPVTDVALIAAVQVLEQDLGARLVSLTTAVTTMDNRVDQRLYTLTNAVDAQSAKTASAIGSSMENANTRAMDLQAEQRNIDSEKNTRIPIDPCANAARGLGNVDMDRSQPALRSGATRPSGMGGSPGSSGGGSSTGSAQLDKAIGVSERNLPAPSPETQQMQAMAGACSAYASNGTVNPTGRGPGPNGLAAGRAAMCQDAGVTPGAGRLPNADVRADTLYDGAQTAANTGKISYTWDDDQMTAARAYVRNLHATVEPRALSKAELNSDEGRQYLGLRDSYMARSAQAQKGEQEWINLMAPNKDTIPLLNAMLDGQGAASIYLRQQLPKEFPQWAERGISFHSLWSLEADRRYQNPKWVAEIATASDPLTIQREQAFMTAHTNYLLTKLLIEAQKGNINSGSIMEAGIDRDFLPTVMEAQKKAIQSRRPVGG